MDTNKMDTNKINTNKMDITSKHTPQQIAKAFDLTYAIEFLKKEKITLSQAIENEKVLHQEILKQLKY